MDDLAQSWNRLSLSDREGLGCCLLDGDNIETFSIAAKFLTKRAINMEIIAKTFTLLWRARDGFKMQSFGDHKILFTFEKKKDVERILDGEPWSFDKHLVVMNRYENESSLQDIKFEKTKLWVQIHGILIKYMTTEVAKKIGSVLGEVFELIDPKIFDGGHFIRIQASIDLSMPLCRGRLISIQEGGKQVWISFKYETLPNLCYWCERLTHDDRDCKLRIDSEGTLTPEQREFGPHLRAPPFVATRKSSIVVPRFYAAKKKVSSGVLDGGDSGRNLGSGRGRTPEQSQEVTDSSEESIDVENNTSLKRNDVDGVIREDTAIKNTPNGTITEDFKAPSVTESLLESNNEEIFLAKLFGVAKIVGLGLTASKNAKACDKLSGKTQLNKSRATTEVRAKTKSATRAIPTCTRRERNQHKDKTTNNFQLHGKKREAELEVDHFGLSAKRFQAVFSEDNTPIVVAGVAIQPSQKK